MKIRNLLLLAIILSSHYNRSYAQNITESKHTPVYIGLGTGLDYGGLGSKLEMVMLPYLGAFVALGYNLNGVGLNAGLSAKILPNQATTPTIQAMFGYNGVASTNNYYSTGKSKETHYGPSFGIGVESKVGKNENKISVGILYPARGNEYKTTIPLTFNIGFNFHLYKSQSQYQHK